jgi:hypothetical protein
MASIEGFWQPQPLLRLLENLGKLKALEDMSTSFLVRTLVSRWDVAIQRYIVAFPSHYVVLMF